MIVDVTQDDIDNGVANDCRNCAIVRALRRYGLLDPIVTVVNIKFRHPDGPDGPDAQLVFDTPERVADWIEWYDGPEMRDLATPFKFALPIAAPFDLVVGTPEWAAHTARRAELIQKKNRAGLNAVETDEYERLQRESGDVIERTSPRPKLDPADRAYLNRVLGNE